MKEVFDVAIVGAGPAGVSAACVLADAGVKTIVFERGDHPGTKNMFGGVLYGQDLKQILPDFLERGCPVERNIVEARVWYLSKEGGYSLSYRDAAFSGERKYNAFTVARAKFDRWYAEQASRKGALIVPSTVVVGLLKDAKGRVTGVVTGRENGEVQARVTLLADGVNSPLAAKTGFRVELKPEHVALAVKETIELPAETIEERFGVRPGDGVTTEMLGEITAGIDGTAILYTNAVSLSLAIGGNLACFVERKVKPYELIESLKVHPMVAPLLEKGKPREYIAHWLTEGGYETIPKLYGDGYLIVGDSAMLFNPLHREGTNMAMFSGKMAAETIIEALNRGDCSVRALAKYAERLAASYVIKDMKKYRRLGRFLHRNKELFDELPHMASFAAREMLTVDGVSKREKQKLIGEKVRREISCFRFLGILWKGWRAIE